LAPAARSASDTAGVCRDHDDELVLATALDAHSACVLSEDADLLDLVPFRGVRILKPAAFWRFEAGADA
jgi:predicted nucleic acid-binding protein